MTLRRTLLALALIAAPSALAQAPRQIPYQGVLADGGTPVTSSTSVTFSLFDVASGGTPLWTETQSVTPDASGVFSARLGSVANLNALSFGEPLWLEVSASGTALGPRTPLGAVPYALAMYGVRVEPKSFAVAPNIIAGHPSNSAGASVYGATISGGGYDNQGPTVDPNTVTANYGTVGGGLDNAVSGQNGTVSGGTGNAVGGVSGTVGGGGSNTASNTAGTVSGGSGNTASGSYATIGGGNSNEAVGAYSVVAGGRDGEASGTNSAVGGGIRNTASGFSSVVSGGEDNRASGSFSTVVSGQDSHARGDLSLAAGLRARAAHAGSFVWADASIASNPATANDSLVTTAPNQFLIRAAGGVGIGTNAPIADLNVQKTDIGITSGALENDAIVIEHEDAVLGLYSNNTLTWGSAITLGEVDTNGNNLNKWTIVRRTGINGNLHFTYGVDKNYGVNNTLMRIDGNGNVYADGAFIGGGADFAEWLPVASSSEAPRAGDLVGVTGGRVGLATGEAEQILIVSSDPAFVGNPDAETGGALVALVGQAEVRLASSSGARVGDLLVASGRGDGTARAVAPTHYDPATDGPVAGRILELTRDGTALALVGVDEAAALRAVVVRQQRQLESQAATIEAVLARLAALESRSVPSLSTVSSPQ